MLSQAARGDGRTRVELDELIALRARVTRSALAPLQSRATRAGQQSSRLYGRGMDYAESRAYQAGDDVRRLDWRLTARSGKLHTKLFQEEREGRLLVLLDCHPGMRFGTRVRFKSVQAARVAALAAWHAERGGERIGMLAFGGRQELLRPRGGLRGVLAVCGALAAWDGLPCDGAEPLSAALRRVAQVQQGASRVLLVSDGWSCDDAARGRLIDLAQRASLYVMVVADALELAPPPAGRYPLEHAGVQRGVALLAERERREFQAGLGAGQSRLHDLARSLALPVRRIDTAGDPCDAVSGLLRVGGRRR